MTAAVESDKFGGRQLAALGLVILNVVLIFLILNEHDLLPFGSSPAADAESSGAAPPPVELQLEFLLIELQVLR